MFCDPARAWARVHLAPGPPRPRAPENGALPHRPRAPGLWGPHTAAKEPRRGRRGRTQQERPVSTQHSALRAGPPGLCCFPATAKAKAKATAKAKAEAEAPAGASMLGLDCNLRALTKLHGIDSEVSLHIKSEGFNFRSFFYFFAIFFVIRIQGLRQGMRCCSSNHCFGHLLASSHYCSD